MKNNCQFTQTEAEEFIKIVVEDIFPNGRVDLLDNYYALDVIGHYKNEVFGIQDIRERMLAIKNSVNTIKFIADNVFVINDLITYSCRQHWINKEDGRFYELFGFGVYRIRNRKVCETWVIYDTPTANAYKQITQDFMGRMQPFELNTRLKNGFLNNLELIQQTYLGSQYKLSKNEKECLYYCLNGFSAKEAAFAMGLSPRTIESYLLILRQKFNCMTIYELRKKIFKKNIT